MEYTDSENAYAAPEATLERSLTGGEQITAFPRFSTWWVLLLSMVTLSIYSLYWIYSRTKILNRLVPENPISFWIYASPILFFIVGIIVNFMIGFYGAEAGSGLTVFSNIVSLVNLIIFIVWAYSFRNRLNRLAGVEKGDKCYAGPILTFFLNSLYMSYKVNQLIDRQREAV
ncbi:DUF4234 domain-containing protein [Motiliproteus sp. MSK22-1]|uniref:DUF4234 domain-containing protein n=1 Tax=Motiliproteus sp. MSK22-1 TaxID=1897630 RepID=UPI000978363B|nr:DUF4234 domain-containing protein [Motiliproteus sp. MSK22-1]OMH29091.1 hypothetical protein BGP75_20260 [Motiliproteus sp. MSK22-1]